MRYTTRTSTTPARCPTEIISTSNRNHIHFQPTSYPLSTDIKPTANRHHIYCQPTSYPLPTDTISNAVCQSCRLCSVLSPTLSTLEVTREQMGHPPRRPGILLLRQALFLTSDDTREAHGFLKNHLYQDEVIKARDWPYFG